MAIKRHFTVCFYDEIYQSDLIKLFEHQSKYMMD